jgi:Phosphogluconate dehydrogenase (decarboxylating) C-term
MRAHRCTVEQLAILEPALSETVGTKFALALREATDEAVRRGVPKPAAIDFIIGHLTIELAIAFGIFPEGKFSDGASGRSTRPSRLYSATGGSTAFMLRRLCSSRSKTSATLRRREELSSRRGPMTLTRMWWSSP